MVLYEIIGGMKDNLRLVLIISGGQWKQGSKCHRKGRDKHLARNLQNSESHLFCFAMDTKVRKMSYSELTDLVSSLLALVRKSRVRIYFPIPRLFTLYKLSFLLIFSVPCAHKNIGVHLCPEYFPNYGAQGAHKLFVLLVKPSRCKQTKSSD